MAKKRSPGEGTIFKLKSGNWCGQIMVGRKADGSRNVKTFTAPTKAEVQDMIRRCRFEEENEADEIPFSKWAEEWYKGYRTQVQPSTYSCYKYTLAKLKEYFGDKALDSFKLIDINKFLDHLRDEGYSLSLIKKCKAMLMQIFTEAEYNDLITKNPTSHAKKIKSKEGIDMEETKKKDAFTDSEISELVNGLPNDLLGNSIMTLIGSGMRVQELLALRPEDISADGSTISVQKAIKTVDGSPLLGPPKSKTSKRVIPIPESYRPFVKFIRQNGGNDYVWESEREDKLYCVGTFRKKYYRCLKNIEAVRPLSPHCCRHTYVTKLQEGGVPIELVARLAGHSSLDMTDHYTHVSADVLAKNVEVLEVPKAN